MPSIWSLVSGSMLRMSLLTVAVGIGCGTYSLAAPPTDFTVESPAQGEKFQLSKAKGKVVALHFLLKTECPICLRHTHAYARLAEQQPDVVHVFLKPDSAEEIKAWTSHLSQDELKDFPVIYRDPDAALAKAYQIPDGYKFHGEVVHFPALVVLDATGTELFRYVGKNNGDRLAPADFADRLAKAGSAGKK